MTVTTVGYGDYDPVTIGGRIIASVLMVTGIGIFGVLTATLTSFFNHSEIDSDHSVLQKELLEIRLLLQQNTKKEEEASADHDNAA